MPATSSIAASRSAAKAVICDLIAASGGALRGKVRLNKAFYFAHLYYWRDAHGILTDYPIVRLPLGPCIDNASELLGELQAEGKIATSTVPVGPYPESVYRLLNAAPAFDPSTPRGKAIQEAIEFVNGKTGAELSDITHEHSPSWRTTPDGQEMSIYTDLLDEQELLAIKASLRSVQDREGAIWPREC